MALLVDMTESSDISSSDFIYVTRDPGGTPIDRAITFTGKFPTISELIMFKPWNKK